MNEPPADGLRAVYPSLRGKRVLITGGGSGIGAGIVEGFVNQGAAVTFFDVAEEDSKALVRQMSGNNTPAFEQVDLLDIGQLQATIGRLVEADGPFDILVNNAANDDRHGIDQVDEAYWDDRFGVNLKHQFLGLRRFKTIGGLPVDRARHRRSSFGSAMIRPQAGAGERECPTPEQR